MKRYTCTCDSNVWTQVVAYFMAFISHYGYYGQLELAGRTKKSLSFLTRRFNRHWSAENSLIAVHLLLLSLRIFHVQVVSDT